MARRGIYAKGYSSQIIRLYIGGLGLVEITQLITLEFKTRLTLVCEHVTGLGSTLYFRHSLGGRASTGCQLPRKYERALPTVTCVSWGGGTIFEDRLGSTKVKRE